jgi:hypothetical protein
MSTLSNEAGDAAWAAWLAGEAAKIKEPKDDEMSPFQKLQASVIGPDEYAKTTRRETQEEIHDPNSPVGQHPFSKLARTAIDPQEQ